MDDASVEGAGQPQDESVAWVPPTSHPVPPAPVFPPPMPYPQPVYPPVSHGPPVPPAAPRPAGRFGWGVLLAVAASVAVLCCAAGVLTGVTIHRGTRVVADQPVRPSAAARASAGTPAVTPSFEPIPSAPPTPGPIAAGDGHALLAKIVAVPAGAHALTVSGSNGGVLNLDQFVARDFRNDPDAKDWLAGYEFQVAAAREWRAADGVEVHVQLIQFGDDGWAEGYVLDQIYAYSEDKTVTGVFSVPATHGKGYEKSTLDAAGNHRAFLVAQDGPLAVEVAFFTPHAYDRAGELALMQQQLVALAGHR